jgi:hypothetical protein
LALPSRWLWMARRISFSSSILYSYFLPSVREKMCWYTPHRHTQSDKRENKQLL